MISLPRPWHVHSSSKRVRKKFSFVFRAIYLPHDLLVSISCQRSIFTSSGWDKGKLLLDDDNTSERKLCQKQFLSQIHLRHTRRRCLSHFLELHPWIKTFKALKFFVERFWKLSRTIQRSHLAHRTEHSRNSSLSKLKFYEVEKHFDDDVRKVSSDAWNYILKDSFSISIVFFSGAISDRTHRCLHISGCRRFP